MPINSDIRDQAYQFFLEEAPELLQVIEVDLLTLRQERSTAKVHNLMRAAHSLKGGSASVGLETIKTLAHRLENIFKAFYSEDLEIDTELESKLLQAYDCLRLPLMEQTELGHFDAEQALSLADPIFTQIEERLGPALMQTDSYLPSSAELGVDMVKSIFEVDVGQGLELLAAIVVDPHAYEVAGELRAQAEVFTGFAELLNLPEFGAIAETVTAALNAHPESALEITQLALADFQRIRQAVLAGDRPQGVGPSMALVALASIQDIERLEVESPLELEGNEEISRVDFQLATLPSYLPNLESIPLLEDIFGSFATAEVQAPVIIDGELVAEAISEVEGGLEAPVKSLEEMFGTEDVNSLRFEALQELPAHPSQPDFVGEAEAPAGLQLDESAPGQLVLKENSQLSQYANGTSSTLHLNQVSPLNRQGEAITPNLTVRVDTERLERMNNLMGELAINRNGLSLQNEQIQGAVKRLLSRFAGFQDIVGQLQQLSDKMLVTPSSVLSENTSKPISAPSTQQRQSPQREEPPNSELRTPHSALRTKEYTQSHFDSLEMDNYGTLHTVIQEIFEDMVQLEEAVEDVGLFAVASEQKLGQQKQMLNYLRDELTWARMLPIGEVLQRFPRMLRDLATTHHKPVNLKLSGKGVLVDKAVLEKLGDPLLHLLRNAFDHGIESPEVRRQLQKPEQGQIEVRAYHKASQTIIEVQDDGQGLNLDRIRSRALELKLLSAEQISRASNAQLFELVFEPGFSTVKQVSELSGRGVGLDVVRSQLRLLKGSVAVTSSPGEGTIFTLKLPITLTITKLLVCFVGAALAIPSDSVEEIVIPKADQTKRLGTQRFLQWQERLIPAYRLADFLRYNCPLPEISQSKVLTAPASPTGWASPMLILRLGTQAFALEIDSVVTEQELAIKPFGLAIAPPSFTYGCTVLGDGTVIPVINVSALLESALVGTAPNTIATVEADVEADSIGPTKILTPNAVPTVLVVDDSVAMRRTLAFTLERSDFRVLQARDGQEALEQLQQSSVQLIICDIEMPNMNGFEFLSHRRRYPELAKIPVVMLTSRSNDKHQRLAVQLGATAYFTKPFVEQGFLQAIKDIIS